MYNFAKIFFVCCFLISSTQHVTAAPPTITAKSAIVMEATTGKILYSKNAEEKKYPASTTKMMSLIVALEYGNLEDVVTASKNAANTEGSSLWLTEGESEKMLDLLYGIMLISGNDATVAVAEHIAGSVENFARLMTDKAHAIGANNTNFTNSSGLPDPNHYSTAHDLAKIAAYGYKNPLFTKIVSTKEWLMPWPGKEFQRDLYNENRMLWLYEGANGVKTGYTDAAGRCLVSGASRDGMQLITVVLDSERMWDDSIALMSYGFQQIKPKKIFDQGEILKTLRVSNGKVDTVPLVTESDLILPIGETDDEFTTVIDAPAKVEAPIKEGEKVGKVIVYYKGSEVTNIELLAMQRVEKKSLFSMIWTFISSIFNSFTQKNN